MIATGSYTIFDVHDGIDGKDGTNGKNGTNGTNGKDGKDAAIQSATAPSDRSQMWLDISLDPPLMKRYDSEKASWVVVNNTSEIVYNLEQNFSSGIKESEKNILLNVSESYTLKDATDSLVRGISTQMELNSKSVDIKFNKFSADIASVAAGTDAEFEEIRKYIRFIDGKILLGEEGNELELQISNDKISFLQDGTEVAYFSSHKFYVKDGHFINSLQFGDFAFLPRANGNLSLKKVASDSGASIVGLAVVGTGTA